MDPSDADVMQPSLACTSSHMLICRSCLVPLEWAAAAMPLRMKTVVMIGGIIVSILLSNVDS